MTLFYCPVERYRERYTFQLSAPGWGWMERNWREAGVDYFRVETPTAPEAIRKGVALDPVRRTDQSFRQVTAMLMLLDAGTLTGDDVIYLEDYWTPGAEQLPYAFELYGVRPRVYANWWAQSVDEYDFTYPMRDWMRYYEKGQLEWIDGVFVACPSLWSLIAEHFGLGLAEKVHAVGHPFDSREVASRMPPPGPRKDQVVYSSRWDKEKDPGFFLAVADEVLSRRPATKFVVCTGADTLRSNDTRLVEAVNTFASLHPDNFEIRTGLTKEEYYAALRESKVQFNCALQDWISYTLLEASVAGCYPVYPRHRSFPEVFLGRPEFMYGWGDVAEAADKLCEVLDRDDLWTPEAVESRSWIHRRFDSTWMRMLDVMQVEYCPRGGGADNDPFDAEDWGL